jgi:thiol-disulfide isomerase/thioredoxin
MTSVKKRARINYTSLGFLHILPLLSLGGLSSCSSSYQWAVTERNEHILVGEIGRAQLTRSDSFKWFDSFYPLYTVKDMAAFNYITKQKGELSFKIICGTWCEDTQILLPRFYNFCDLQGIANHQVKLIAVDRKKELNNHKPNGYGVTSVPTIIIYKNKKEAGRIVESISHPLELEIQMILEKK